VKYLFGKTMNVNVSPVMEITVNLVWYSFEKKKKNTGECTSTDKDESVDAKTEVWQWVWYQGRHGVFFLP